MPLAKGHLDWMAYIRMEAANAGIELSVCILEYGSCYRRGSNEAYTYCSDLVPTNPYPRQMTQGIFALNHLLDNGYRPSDVCRLSP